MALPRWYHPICAGAGRVSGAVPRCAGDRGAALVTQRWPVLQEKCTLWLSACMYVCADLCFVPHLPGRLIGWAAASSDVAKSGYWLNIIFVANYVIMLKGRLVRDSQGLTVYIYNITVKSRNHSKITKAFLAWYASYLSHDETFRRPQILGFYQPPSPRSWAPASVIPTQWTAEWWFGTVQVQEVTFKVEVFVLSWCRTLDCDLFLWSIVIWLQWWRLFD